MDGPKNMIGIDIVDIDQIRHVHAKHGAAFLQKILNPEEIAELSGVSERVFPRVLGQYFAAKEAIFKACGDERISWTHITVTGITKIPRVLIKRPGFDRKIMLTFSFDRAMVIAQALVSP